MSLVKFGSIVTSGSGSLGGATIQPFRSTHVLRKKPLPPKSRTPAQLLIRSYNKTMQAGWRSLAEPLRKTWNEYPKIHNICNNTGDKYPLSGHSLWMKYQYAYLSNEIPFLSDPSNYLPEPLGPELIINGGFDSLANWNIIGPSHITDGKLYFIKTGIGADAVYQDTPAWTPYHNYRLVIHTDNIIGSPQYGIAARPWFCLQNGRVVYVSQTDRPYSVFYFISYDVSSCTIDYVSIRKIL